MNKDDYIRDGLGWIDDLRALPGECGTPMSRKIYAHCLINQGTSINKLKKMGFSREIISEVTESIVDETYKLSVGDLVQEFLTEKIGVVIEVSGDSKSYKCQWQTTGLSMESCGAGTSEWVGWQSLETLNENR